MDFKIDWAEQATIDLENIVAYLKLNWSVNVLNNFSLNLKKKLQTLRKFPLSGSESNIKNYRKKLITKHSYLLYRVKENRIEILSILDTRQNSK